MQRCSAARNTWRCNRRIKESNPVTPRLIHSATKGEFEEVRSRPRPGSRPRAAPGARGLRARRPRWAYRQGPHVDPQDEEPRRSPAADNAPCVGRWRTMGTMGQSLQAFGIKAFRTVRTVRTMLSFYDLKRISRERVRARRSGRENRPSWRLALATPLLDRYVLRKLVANIGSALA